MLKANPIDAPRPSHDPDARQSSPFLSSAPDQHAISIEAQPSRVIAPAAIEMTSDADIVETVERMVLAALPKRLSDKRIAYATGVKVTDLNRAFIAVRGAAIYPALHALRLDEADRIFSETPGASPEAVALQCGFGHYGVFHRNYRLRFGREPGELRHAQPPEEERTFAAGDRPGPAESPR